MILPYLDFSWEIPGMNGVRNPKYENRIYDILLPHGLSLVTWGNEVPNIFLLVVDPPRGRPFGGGGVHRNQKGKDP